MSCAREGHYQAKHPAGTMPNPAVAEALKQVAAEGRITCEQAHALARKLRVVPPEVGKTADLLELRIAQCQLGLFGYEPEKKIARALETVPEDLRQEIERRAADGKIACASCWQVADIVGTDRLTVGSACETLGVKVVRCQLGAF